MSQLATAVTPSSSYFSADKDNVMDKVFSHCAVWVSNVNGQKTVEKVFYIVATQKLNPKPNSLPNKSVRLKWNPHSRVLFKNLG